MTNILKELLTHYPDAINDKRRFKALLYDYFPLRKKEANAIFMTFEIGIPDNMKTIATISPIDISRYQKQLAANYGLDRILALTAIKSWLDVLEISYNSSWFDFEDDIMNNFYCSEETEEIDFLYTDNNNEIYDKLTLALKNQNNIIRKKYRNSEKDYDEIILELFRNKDYTHIALDSWLYLIENYFDYVLSKSNDPHAIIELILKEFSDADLDALIDNFEEHKDLMQNIFIKSDGINDILFTLLEKLALRKRYTLLDFALNFITNRQDKVDYIQNSNFQKCIRSCLNNISTKVIEEDLNDLTTNINIDHLFNTIELIVNKITNTDRRESLTFDIENALNRIAKNKELSQIAQENQRSYVQSTTWNFAGLKEEAVAYRKIHPTWREYNFISFTTVVGFHYVENKEAILKDLKKGKPLFLQREPNNKYDSMAVALYDTRNRKVGYLPKESNTFIATMMDSGKEFIARLYDIQTTNNTTNIAIEIFIK